MDLREIDFERYAREVLPLTAPLWSGRRSFPTYVDQTRAIAASGYGRRHYRTLGLYEGATLLASFKRYGRVVRDGNLRLRAIGIGAVYTPPDRRGRGYASAMLGQALDRARRDGHDLAYLFSDIHPRFYEQLGFQTLASREFSLRADTLAKGRIEVARMEERDWSGVRRCFELTEAGRSAGFVRSPLVWEWIRLRFAHGSERPEGAETNLVVRRGRSIGAYVFGTRAPARDAFVLDEFGFADAAADLVPALLRAACGDLRRLTGWVPPENARALLPRGAARKRKTSILMIAPLTRAGTRLVAAAASSGEEFCWATDHI